MGSLRPLAVDLLGDFLELGDPASTHTGPAETCLLPDMPFFKGADATIMAVAEIDAQ